MASNTDIIAFLKYDRSLLSARNLYNKLPNKNLATQSYISRLANTASNVRIVSYELCKLVGIKERQMNALLNQPLKTLPKIQKVEKSKELSTKEMQNKLLEFVPTGAEEEVDQLATFLNINFTIPEFSKGLSGSQERKNLAKELNIEVAGNKHNDYDAAFEIYKKEYIVAEITEKKEAFINTQLQELDIKTKESIKLRDQFPFLKEKDCPRVLHLLVADLITAHEVFVEKQPLLHKNATQEQLKQLVKEVTVSYIEKKEIYAELEYYKENNSLLGKHPIFEQLQLEKEIKELNAVDLAKKVSNLVNNVNRNKKKLENAENDSDKEKYQGLIAVQTQLKEFAEKELANRK